MIVQPLEHDAREYELEPGRLQQCLEQVNNNSIRQLMRAPTSLSALSMVNDSSIKQQSESWPHPSSGASHGTWNLGKTNDDPRNSTVDNSSASSTAPQLERGFGRDQQLAYRRWLSSSGKFLPSCRIKFARLVSATGPSSFNS